MEPNYLFYQGRLTENKSAKDVLEKIITGLSDNSAFSLVQTISSCELMAFDPEDTLIIADIEQYRAFCPEWELWVKALNPEDIRFRCIAERSVCKPPGSNVEFDLQAIDPPPFAEMRTESYPLWGEPLISEKHNISGCWFTERIPRLLHYPVQFPGSESGARVYLKTENFIGMTGRVEMVRFHSLYGK